MTREGRPRRTAPLSSSGKICRLREARIRPLDIRAVLGTEYDISGYQPGSSAPAAWTRSPTPWAASCRRSTTRARRASDGPRSPENRAVPGPRHGFAEVRSTTAWQSRSPGYSLGEGVARNSRQGSPVRIPCGTADRTPRSVPGNMRVTWPWSSRPGQSGAPSSPPPPDPHPTPGLPRSPRRQPDLDESQRPSVPQPRLRPQRRRRPVPMSCRRIRGCRTRRPGWRHLGQA